MILVELRFESQISSFRKKKLSDYEAHEYFIVFINMYLYKPIQPIPCFSSVELYIPTRRIEYKLFV